MFRYPRILVIGGPTAAGKSAIAMAIAASYPAEIVNADSRQIYHGLLIGTNQPSESQRSIVPHHLFAFLPPDTSYTASDYEKQSLQTIESIQRNGKLAIVVGGTGFYLKALLKGSWPAPPKNEQWRKRFSKIEHAKGKDYLYRILQRIDPAGAAAIAINDTYRVIRSLEIFFQTGKRRSALKTETQGGDRIDAVKLSVVMDKEKLDALITERTEQMFARGWVEEVRTLLQRYPGFAQMPAASSLGYPEIIRYLAGEMDLPACKLEIIRKTIQYAKRQQTWFRNQDQFTPVRDVEAVYKILHSVLELH